jgi:hypothetical protein
MEQKEVMLNLIANPFKKSEIWLREELMYELSSLTNMRIRLIRMDQKVWRNRCLEFADLNKMFPNLPANSKNLCLTRNDFMERSNHMEALIILYFKRIVKKVASRMLLCGGIV